MSDGRSIPGSSKPSQSRAAFSKLGGEDSVSSGRMTVLTVSIAVVASLLGVGAVLLIQVAGAEGLAWFQHGGGYAIVVAVILAAMVSALAAYGVLHLRIGRESLPEQHKWDDSGTTPTEMDWLWETDRSHRITRLSSPFNDALDRKVVGTLLGKARWEVADSVPITGPWADLIALMDARRPIHDFEYMFRQNDEMDRVFVVNGTPLFGDGGIFVGYKGVSRDITKLHRARGERDRAEQLLLHAVNSIPVAIALFDADDRLVLWNDHYAKNVALAAQLVKGMTLEDILRSALAVGLIPEAQGKEEDWLRSRLTKHRSPQGTFLIHLGSQTLRLREHRTGDGQTLLIANDITVQQAAEEKLLHQKQLIETIVEHVPHAIFWKDRNGVYLGCNLNFVRYRGLASKDQIVGKRIQDFALIPEEIDVASKNDRYVVTTGNSKVNTEESLTRADGSKLDVLSSKVPLYDGDGGIIGLVGIFADITERKLAEAELAASEARFRDLIEHSVHGIYIHREGKPLFVNQACADIFGYQAPRDILALGSMRSLYAPADWRRMRAYSKRRLAGEIVPTRYEVHGVKKDGSPVWIELEVRVVDWYGEPAFQSTLVDISARKQVERQLRQTQRMRALGSLAGGVAHELNNLLLPILTLSQMMMKAAPDDSREHQKLERIVEASERAKDLVAKVMEFSRQEDSVPEKIDIHHAVAEGVNFLKAALPSTMTIETALDPAAGTILADPSQIQTVLMNLGSNATDAYEGRPGTVRVSLQPVTVEREQALRIVNLQAGRYVQLSVEDGGKGMDADILERVFEPFFTTKEVGEGTGLGLAVVHGIVERHGGVIRVDSQIGRGTTVEIYLPLMDEDN